MSIASCGKFHAGPCEADKSYADALKACTGASHVTVTEERRMADGTLATTKSEHSEITPNEKALLLAIRDSEYNDGADKTSPVWINCLWGFEGKKKFGGVMASLTKKGLANTDGECAWLTETGLDLIRDEAYKCTIDRASDEQGYVASEDVK